MPYNSVADSIHTKKLCSRLSSSEVHFLTKKGYFAFSSPLWDALKPCAMFILRSLKIVDFLLVIIDILNT